MTVPSKIHRDSREKPRYVREMFARIARSYDLMNTLMTGAQDRRWRDMAVQAARSPEFTPEEWSRGLGLDVAAGTGDLALALARRSGLAGIVAVDLVPEMLDVARIKVERAGYSASYSATPLHPSSCHTEAGGAFARHEQRHRPPVHLVVGDGLRLPFADDTFACVTVGFGVRNFADLPRGFAEMRRVLKPGGRVVCLELSRSPNAAFNALFDLYFDHCVPLVGGLVARDMAAYRYLPSSVKAFPPAPDLADIMRAAGLRNVEFRRLGLGTVALHIGTK